MFLSEHFDKNRLNYINDNYFISKNIKRENKMGNLKKKRRKKIAKHKRKKQLKLLRHKKK